MDDVPCAREATSSDPVGNLFSIGGSSSSGPPEPACPVSVIVDANGNCSNSPTLMMADEGVISTYGYPYWEDRIQSSFTQYAPDLFTENGVCITLSLANIMPTIAYSRLGAPTIEDPVNDPNCNVNTGDNDPAQQFSAWLAANQYNGNAASVTNSAGAGVEHFQLWTSEDLYFAGGTWWPQAECIAVAVPDKAEKPRETDPDPTGGNINAVSVVEAISMSYWWAQYDADDAFQRGIASAHELSHVYGVWGLGDPDPGYEGHPEEDYYDPGCWCRHYNLMQNGIPQWWKVFWLIPYSQDHIEARYFDRTEP